MIKKSGVVFARPGQDRMGTQRDRAKRVLLTRAEERAVEHLIEAVGQEIGCKLTLSHVLRAFLKVLCEAEGDIMEEARQAGPLRRPPNTDPDQMEHYERELGQLLIRAFQRETDYST